MPVPAWLGIAGGRGAFWPDQSGRDGTGPSAGVRDVTRVYDRRQVSQCTWRYGSGWFSAQRASRLANSFGCGSRGGMSRGGWECVVGVARLVDSVSFLSEVEDPVRRPVAVAA